MLTDDLNWAINITFTLYPCELCGWCCKNLEIPLEVKDIKQIAKHLKITKTEFKNMYCEWLRKEKEPTKLILKRPCQFLNDVNMCTIYDLRPDVAKNYPINRDPDGMMITLKNVGKCKLATNLFDDFNRWFQENRGRFGVFEDKYKDVKEQKEQEYGANPFMPTELFLLFIRSKL